MLCRVYTCWIPARRSSHIWSRPMGLSPCGFWVRFDDIVEPAAVSSPAPNECLSAPLLSLRFPFPNSLGSHCAIGRRGSVSPTANNRWRCVPHPTPALQALPDDLRDREKESRLLCILRFGGHTAKRFPIHCP